MRRALTAFAAILLTLGAGLTGAQSADESGALAACNAHYHRAAYAEAVSCYEEIGANGMSAPLYYNIANSYARSDETGRAVLNYLRALCLQPGDADSAGNLDLLRTDKGLFPPEPDLSRQLLHLLSVGQWSMVALSALLAYLIFSLSRLKTGYSFTREVMMALFCTVVFTGAAAGAWARYQEWRRSVVVIDDRLLVSPFAGAAPVGSIQQGRLLTVHKSHNGFIYVTDETGRDGWLPEIAAEPILPR